MSVFLVVLLFLVGLILIIKGGDLFVDAASWIAEAFRIPKFIIGATIVSLATTLPELIVSTTATAQGSLGLAIGNAVGSVNGNLGLIMGISIVCLPSMMKRTQFAVKGILMILASVLLYLFSMQGQLGIVGSICMLLVFAFFLFLNVKEARASMADEPAAGDVTHTQAQKWPMLCRFILGTAGIVIGAQLLVTYGSEIARLVGVPESVIGVTLVAIGTSLPELVTTITAIRKKQAALSIGNIIGANIIDLTVILPVCAVISGGSLPILPQTIRLDLPVCIGFCLLSILPAIISGRFRRAQGVVMLLCYAAYVAVLCINPAIGA